MSEVAELPKSKKIKGGVVASKISINSKRFLKGCDIASKAIDTKSIVPAISNILVIVEEGFLSFTGTNLKQTIITKVDYPDMFGKSRFMFPTALGIKLLQNLPDAAISISHITTESESLGLKTTHHAIEITCGGNSYTLETENPDEYVKVNSIADETPIIINKDAILKGLMYCKSSASEDDLRPALTGINFIIKENLSIIATDGFSLAQYVADLEREDDREFTFLIPSKASNILNELSGETIEIRLSGNGVEFSDKTTSIFSLLIDERYPDYQNAIPNSHETESVVSVSDIKSALSRVSILSGSDSATTAMTLNESGIEINIIDSNYNNDGTEIISIDRFDGPDIKIGFNPYYLTRVLSKITSGTIRVEVSQPNRPILIYPSSETGLLLLIMPTMI